ncbi:MAG: MFS transporter [Bryobacteraceae bacterium]|nr:MFS transporter [Bryobacteraceae bacterium]
MKNSRYAWLVVALLWVVALLNYLDRQVIFSMFPVLRAEMRLSDLELGLVGSSFLWVYGLCSPFSGFLADRYGRRRVLITSLIVWSVLTWLTGQARNLHELLLARALMGVSEACYLPAALALIADYHDESSRSRATGLHYSGIYAGIVLGGVGGGWVAEHYGWRLAFTILGAVGVLYAIVLLAFLKEKPSTERKDPVQPRFLASAQALLGIRGFPILMSIFAAVSVANWLVYTWMPLYLYERFGMNLTASGFSATFYVQLGSVAGILVGGAMADRWFVRNQRGRVWTQAVGIAAAAPFLFISGFTSVASLLLVGLAVFGLGRGMYDSNGMPVLCQVVPAELRSTGFGLLNMAGTFSGGFVALGAGALKETVGLGALLQGAGVLLLLSAFALARLPLASKPH